VSCAFTARIDEAGWAALFFNMNKPIEKPSHEEPEYQSGVEQGLHAYPH
jgi:hypothetical protein